MEGWGCDIPHLPKSGRYGTPWLFGTEQLPKKMSQKSQKSFKGTQALHLKDLAFLQHAGLFGGAQPDQAIDGVGRAMRSGVIVANL